LEEGALGEEGASLAGRTFRAQIAVRFVSGGSYSSVSEYCGRFSPSELPVGRELQFSGLDNIFGGSTFLGRTCFSWACIVAWIKLLLYQVLLFIVLAVFHLLFSIYIHSYSKLVFPEVVLSRVMLTKNTCVVFIFMYVLIFLSHCTYMIERLVTLDNSPKHVYFIVILRWSNLITFQQFCSSVNR
jgi:hypothetical protein